MAKRSFAMEQNVSKEGSTLINPSVDIKREKFISDKHSRFVFLKTPLEDNSFVLANIYAPKDVAQQTSFCSKLSKHLEEFAHDPSIIKLISSF